MSNRFVRGKVILLVIIVVCYSQSTSAGYDDNKEEDISDWWIKGALAALDDRDPQVVRETLSRMVENHAGDRVPASKLAVVEGLLKKSDWRDRVLGCRLLGARKESAKRRASKLGEMLNDSHESVRAAAAYVLGEMGEAAGDQSPKLVKLLRDPFYGVLSAAAEALGKMKLAASEQASNIVELLTDSGGSMSLVRQAAVLALRNIGEAAREQAPQIGDLLNHSNPDVRTAATKVLGKLGDSGKDQAPKLLALLNNNKEDVEVRCAAAVALGEMGDVVDGQARLFGEMLSDSDTEMKLAAIEALGLMREAAYGQIPKIVEMLADSDQLVRREATDALSKMGEAVKPHAPKLIKMILNSDSDIRHAPVDALVNLGNSIENQMPKLVEMLNVSDIDICCAAVKVLGGMGNASKAYVSKLGKLLDNSDVNIKEAAATALGGIGEAAGKQASKLTKLLRYPYYPVQSAAANALGKMGDAGRAQASTLVQMLGDPDKNIRIVAAIALKGLGNTGKKQELGLLAMLRDADYRVVEAASGTLLEMGKVSLGQVPTLIKLLGGADDNVQSVVSTLIDGMGPLQLEHTLSVLEMTYTDSVNQASYLSNAHIWGGGNAEVETITNWLGHPDKLDYLPIETTEDFETRITFFNHLWPNIKNFPYLRKDFSARINALLSADAHLKCTDNVNISLLETLEENLRPVNPTVAKTISRIISSKEQCDWISKVSSIAGLSFLGHGFLWLLFIFAYPKYQWVRSFFFWNKSVRRIFGFGYVGPLLANLPFLRRRLLAPFSSLLLADADLDNFEESTYYKSSLVRMNGTDNAIPLLDALGSVHGQVVLQGESGLGKSMYMRYLVYTSKRMALFLSAPKCTNGIIEHLQNMFEGPAKDPDFMKSLIFNGGLDVYIDGLNEVSPDTRARIVQFAEKSANIVLATQPLEWKPPSKAKIFELQPLNAEQINEFLYTRWPLWKGGAKQSEDGYRTACEKYVAKELSDDRSPESRRFVEVTMSNPMDLTIISQMLAMGEEPNLMSLLEQYYKTMAEDYLRVHPAEFPLSRFSRYALEKRLADVPELENPEFSEAFAHMEKHRMVIRHDEGDRTVWYFRHDKIADFFTAQQFLGENNANIMTYMGDPRFRGVYLLLAHLMSPEDATFLRDQLAEYAADTGDHTVSDAFIRHIRNIRTAKAVDLIAS